MANDAISKAFAVAEEAFENGPAVLYSPLRAALDAAGVTDAERIIGMRERINEASELLGCTSFDGTRDTNPEAVASALDKLLDAAESLCDALEELTEITA